MTKEPKQEAFWYQWHLVENRRCPISVEMKYGAVWLCSIFHVCDAYGLYSEETLKIQLMASAVMKWYLSKTKVTPPLSVPTLFTRSTHSLPPSPTLHTCKFTDDLSRWTRGRSNGWEHKSFLYYSTTIQCVKGHINFKQLKHIWSISTTSIS